MKYAFFGTPEFASIILERLIKANFIPEAIICNPDRPIGRKKTIMAPPAKSVALKHNIKVYQPEKLEVDAFSEINGIDLFIVAAYGKIIPQGILNIPKLSTIGVHPSLLPKYRGASPIQSVILNGEEITGTTLFLIDEKMDHGPVIAQKNLEDCNLQTINYEKLMEKLAELSADLLIEILPEFIEGNINPLPQNENDATFTKKFVTEDAFVDLQKENPVEIERKVRAFNPEPGAWTIKEGKRMKILEAQIDSEGNLILKKIQLEGKKTVSI